jgi:mRNA (guanine-N7-)-methyltransferase
MFSAEFIAADCTKERLKEKYKNPGIPIDLVSVQFGFHYSFESLTQVEKMLQNISDNLKYGGYFVGTVPNADRIVQRYREAGQKEFGNSVFTIKFETGEPLPLFGAKYYFQLDEVVNCPEFLVHFPCLEELAAQYNLKLVYKYNFDEYFYKKQKEGEFLLNKMQALEMFPAPGGQSFDEPEEFSHARAFLDENRRHPVVGTISRSEWDAISLYIVFCFQKVANR